MSPLNCISCGGSRHKTLYHGPIRAGTPGMETKEHHEVVACENCGLTRLKEFPLSDDYYNSPEYREAYNGTAAVEDYLKTHDPEQTQRFARIGMERFRGAVTLDYGCGGGSFLDLVKGAAAHTCGIEPFQGFHNDLKARGHAVFPSAEQALEEMRGKCDVVVSFGVIEHVPDPLAYLRNVKDLLRPGGQLFLETDNLGDVLMRLRLDEFDRFFYRTAHFWYFTGETLGALTAKAGLTTSELGYRHTYDLSNALLWMRDRKPTGLGRLQLFSAEQDRAWRQGLEANGMADLIWLHAATRG